MKPDKPKITDRAEFIRERMRNLPGIYSNQLGNDPEKWESEAQLVAGEFKADMARMGAKVPDIGGDRGGGMPLLGMVRPDNRTGAQLIADGLKKVRTIRTRELEV